MPVRIQLELIKTFYFMITARPARYPDLSPIEHVWYQLKRKKPLCHCVKILDGAVKDLWGHLPQNNIRRLINSMLDHIRHMLQQAAFVRRAIELALYLSNCTHCIFLIV